MGEFDFKIKRYFWFVGRVEMKKIAFDFKIRRLFLIVGYVKIKKIYYFTSAAEGCENTFFTTSAERRENTFMVWWEVVIEMPY